jgi:hypothetical protein
MLSSVKKFNGALIRFEALVFIFSVHSDSPVVLTCFTMSGPSTDAVPVRCGGFLSKSTGGTHAVYKIFLNARKEPMKVVLSNTPPSHSFLRRHLTLVIPILVFVFVSQHHGHFFGYFHTRPSQRAQL